jgi:hypothetical protein
LFFDFSRVDLSVADKGFDASLTASVPFRRNQAQITVGVSETWVAFIVIFQHGRRRLISTTAMAQNDHGRIAQFNRSALFRGRHRDHPSLG